MKGTGLYIYPFLKYQEGYGLARGTIRRTKYYLMKLSRFLGDIDLRDIGRDEITDYVEYLKTLRNNRGHIVSELSIKTELSMIKGFFEWLYKSEEILFNPTEDIEILCNRDGKERKIFTEEDIALFLDSIGTDLPVEQRDKALFELMYSSGLRVGELRNLKLDELNLEERICFIIRKGKKEGYVPFSEVSLKFLLKYIQGGRKQFLKRLRNQDEKNILFLSTRGKISWKVLRTRFNKYLMRCGLKDKGYVMHSIRHTTATHLIAAGASIRYVQELLGHESLATTQIYTRPGAENIKRVYRTYHPRENDLYMEIDSEYLNEVRKLKEGLIWQRERYGKKREGMRRVEEKKKLKG
jgi:integrase/recombinase XerC